MCRERLRTSTTAPVRTQVQRRNAIPVDFGIVGRRTLAMCKAAVMQGITGTNQCISRSMAWRFAEQSQQQEVGLSGRAPTVSNNITIRGRFLGEVFSSMRTRIAAHRLRRSSANQPQVHARHCRACRAAQYVRFARDKFLKARPKAVRLITC